MGNSAPLPGHRCCYERPKNYLIKGEAWRLLGKECVCGSIASGRGFPCWSLYVASNAQYDLNQIQPLRSHAFDAHLSNVDELEEAYRHFGQVLLGSAEGIYNWYSFPHPGSPHGIWIPGECALELKSCSEAYFGKPRFTEYVDDGRLAVTSEASTLQAKVTNKGVSAEGSHTANVSRSAGKTHVIFDIVWPMAKLVLTGEFQTDKRYIRSVVVGFSLKLRGSYDSKGPESESITQAANASIFPWFFSFGGSESKQSSKGAHSSSWEILESKGIILPKLNASNTKKMKESIHWQMDQAKNEPHLWEVLFVQTNTDDFLSPEEHRVIEAIPTRAVGYLDSDPENFLTGLASPALKQVLCNLYRLNGADLNVPPQLTTKLALGPEQLEAAESATNYGATVLEFLVNSMSPEELILEEAAFTFIQKYGFVAEGWVIKYSSHALKFWWSHLRNTASLLRTTDLNSSHAHARPASIGPYPTLPAAKIAEARILVGYMQPKPVMPPVGAVAEEVLDDGSDVEEY